MSKLASLHNQLSALRSTRATVRLVTAFAAFATAVLWALIGIFLLDVLFELPLIPRLIVMVTGLLACFWAYVKYTQPMLGVRETELDMALMVERQQNIDSDLVAALQFESPEAARWGSRQLETAVIDYVAEFGRGLNVFEGFSREQMTRRATILGITVLVVLGFVLIAPSYAQVFFNRLLLGSQHYPSDTVIESVYVNHVRALGEESGGLRPAPVKAAQGQTMLFYVRCTGDLPPTGTLRVRAARGGTSRKVDMVPLTTEERADLLRQAQAMLEEAVNGEVVDISAPWRNRVGALLAFDAGEAARLLDKVGDERAALGPVIDEVKKTLGKWPEGVAASAVYRGDMGRLVDAVSYSVLVGDAWTDPASVLMIPLPVVDLQTTITPPKYARSATGDEKPDSRQISVLEGSRVALRLDAVNDKPLKEVWLTAKTKEKTEKYSFTKADEQGLAWTLPPTGTPLAEVREEIRYEVQVIDSDDLNLETPIRGAIRIRPDRPPSGSAEVVHRVVLPTARPVIGYRLNDDYGISRLALRVDVERGEDALGTSPPVGTSIGDTPTSPAALASQEKPTHFVLHSPNMAPLPTPEPVRGTYTLDMSKLKLSKGDRLKLTLEITDYRGEAPGQTYLSDPLVLEISDESGVLAAISEADERSEQRLTDIIKKQLGIGESP